MPQIHVTMVRLFLLNDSLCSPAVSRDQVLTVPQLARPVDEDEEAVRPPDADVSIGARLQLLASLPTQEDHRGSTHLGA